VKVTLCLASPEVYLTCGSLPEVPQGCDSCAIRLPIAITLPESTNSLETIVKISSQEDRPSTLIPKHFMMKNDACKISPLQKIFLDIPIADETFLLGASHPAASNAGSDYWKSFATSSPRSRGPSGMLCSCNEVIVYLWIVSTFSQLVCGSRRIGVVLRLVYPRI
jgi:hypothetical protein